MGNVLLVWSGSVGVGVDTSIVYTHIQQVHCSYYFDDTLSDSEQLLKRMFVPGFS